MPDLSRHGKRFLLVMGDVDHGDSAASLESTQFESKLLAQLSIQRPERLIEQENRRPGKMIARPSATRCCWPPESWTGNRFPRSDKPTSSKISATFL